MAMVVVCSMVKSFPSYLFLSLLLSIARDVQLAGKNFLVDHGHQVVVEAKNAMVHICRERERDRERDRERERERERERGERSFRGHIVGADT